MNTLISERLIGVLELLEYKFELTKNVRPDFKVGEKIKVPLMLKDVEGTGIDHRDFHMLLDQIAQLIPEIEIPEGEVFDYNNLALGVMEHHKEEFGYELPFAVVLLPINFVKLVDKLKKKESTSDEDVEHDLLYVKKIEVLEDKTGNKRIVIFINTNYKKSIDLSRKKSWENLYKIATDETVFFNKKTKRFFDYVNFNKKNRLYAREGYSPTKILKVEDSCIVANIEIKIITSKQLTQLLKSA